jgi:serine/threonine protein kinase
MIIMDPELKSSFKSFKMNIPIWLMFFPEIPTFQSTRRSKSCVKMSYGSTLEVLQQHFSAGVLSLDDFDIHGEVGRGGFGRVVRGVHRSSGKSVAIKLLFTDESLDEDLLQDFSHEVEMLWKCRFPFVLCLYGFTVTPPLAIIMPFVNHGSLYDYTRSIGAKVRLTGTQKTLIAIGVAYGMSFLHKANVIHRDLKSMNILLDSRLLPFICDFGIARTIEGKNEILTQDCGTTYWMAPEQMSCPSYDSKVDVYSYGMVLYEMLCEKFPFQGHDQIAGAREVAQGKRPELPASGNKKICELIRSCWAHDPKKRPNFTDIYTQLIKGKIGWDHTIPKALKAMQRLIESTNSQKGEPSTK